VPSRSHPASVTDLIEALRAAVVDGPGVTPPPVRRAAYSGDAVPADAGTYVDKVRRHAYKVTDADVDALRSADAIFEITVATALGSALSRRERARRAMGR
jgi:hypothetical protein